MAPRILLVDIVAKSSSFYTFQENIWAHSFLLQEQRIEVREESILFKISHEDEEDLRLGQ